MDGLKGPAVAPSFGVHFGSLPSSYQGFSPFGGPVAGNTNPLGLDLGPVSVNPFVGVKVTKLDGRPILTPSLDLLVSPNAKGVHEIEKFKKKIKGEPDYYDYDFGPPIHDPFAGPVLPGPIHPPPIHPPPIHPPPIHPAPIHPPAVHPPPFIQQPPFHQQPFHREPIHQPLIHQGPVHSGLVPPPAHVQEHIPFRPEVIPPSIVPSAHRIQNDNRFVSTPIVNTHNNRPQVHNHQHHHEHTHIHKHESLPPRPTSGFNSHFQGFARTQSPSTSSPQASALFREDSQNSSAFRGESNIISSAPNSSPIFKRENNNSFQPSPQIFREPRHQTNEGETRKFVFPHT